MPARGASVNRVTMSAMPSRVTLVHAVALAIALSGCGRPELVSVERFTLTVAERTELSDGGLTAVVVRDDCPTDRRRLTAPPGPSRDCLARWTLGARVEQIRAIYKHPAVSCGLRDGDPRNGIGGCPMDSVRSEQLGTACPRPAPAP